jgi:hypothetical protein
VSRPFERHRSDSTAETDESADESDGEGSGPSGSFLATVDEETAVWAALTLLVFDWILGTGLLVPT